MEERFEFVSNINGQSQVLEEVDRHELPCGLEYRRTVSNLVSYR